MRLQKGYGIFAALDVCDTTNIIKISWGVCSANCLHCCAALTPGKASQTHQSRFFMMWLCPWRVLLSPQLSGRLCWFLLLIDRVWGVIFNIPVVKCSLQSPSLLGAGL